MSRKTWFVEALLALTKPGRFLVLCYHRVNDDGHPFFGGTPKALFREQMEVLREHFTVRPLAELALGAAPKNAVAITFDDGYRDNYTEAFPILRELGLSATIFLVTDSIDGNRMIWHDVIFDAYHRSAAAIDKPRELEATLRSVRRASPEARERIVEETLQKLEVTPRASGWEKLSWGEVREMSRAGIGFGAHTLDHAILSRVSPEEARRQVRGSKERIEAELGSKVTTFAYPNGGPDDFDETTKTILREEGFVSAVTTLPGANDAATDRLELRRVGMWGDDPHLSLLRLALARARG